MTPTLSIDVLDGRLRCRLDAQESDTVLPLHEEFSVPLSRRDLASLVTQVATLLRAGVHPGFLNEARDVGTILYATLIPPPLRHRLRGLDGTLLVSTSLHGIAWELVHDGEDFWGLRYALGKRIVTDCAFTVLPEHNHRRRPRALVIGSDPYGDLRLVDDEVERIATVLERHADVACMNGTLSTVEAVTRRLTDGFDLVHYCGHIVHRETTGACLVLADARPLPCALIQPNLVGRPIVFLNGCASAQGADDGSLRWDRLMEAAAYTFLSGGAIATIGTLTDVADEHAARFAEVFYERVIASASLGEAVRDARAICKAEPTSRDSPSWLSFVLYGDPSLTFRDPPLRRGPTPRPLAGVATEVRRLTTDLERATTVRRPPPMVRRKPPARSASTWWTLGIAIAVASSVLWFRHAGKPHGIALEAVATENSAPAASEILQTSPLALATLLSDVAHLRPRTLMVVAAGDTNVFCRPGTACSSADRFVDASRLHVTILQRANSLNLTGRLTDSGGVVIATAMVTGRLDLLDVLQTDLVLKLLASLDVELTREEKDALYRDRQNAGEFQRLLLASVAGSLGLPAGDASAILEPAARPEGSAPLPDPVRTALAAYTRAIEEKNVAALAGLQPGMSVDQRRAIEQYFDRAASITTKLWSVTGRPRYGGGMTVAFVRHDLVTPADGEAPRHVHVNVALVMTATRSGLVITPRSGASDTGGRAHVRRHDPTPRAPSGVPAEPSNDAAPEQPAVPNAVFSELFDDRGALARWRAEDATLAWAEGEGLSSGETRTGALRIDAEKDAVISTQAARAAFGDCDEISFWLAGPPVRRSVELQFRASSRVRWTKSVDAQPEQNKLDYASYAKKQWVRVAVPLRDFRSEGIEPLSWEDVDSFGIRFPGASHDMLLDGIACSRGSASGAAYQSLTDLDAKVFQSVPHATYFAPPFVVFSDATTIPFQDVASALRLVVAKLQRDFPGARMPRRPIPLFVLANDAEMRGAVSRLSGADSSAEVATSLGGSGFVACSDCSSRASMSAIVWAAASALIASTTVNTPSTWVGYGIEAIYEHELYPTSSTWALRHAFQDSPVSWSIEEIAGGRRIDRNDDPSKGRAWLVMAWLLDDSRFRGRLPALVMGMREQRSTDLRPLVERYLGLSMARANEAFRDWLSQLPAE